MPAQPQHLSLVFFGAQVSNLAKMTPEEIQETLLEALDAGMGHETISVKASEEAIAEANSALPEELRLQVA